MWTFSRKLAIAFAVPVLLLAAIGFIGYRTADSLATTSYRVTHTHAVIEHIATLTSLAKDAETGQRGFVITGDPAFLEPYDAALRDIPKTLKELRELTADSATQQRHLDEAEGYLKQKLAELARTVALRRTSSTEVVAKIVSDGEGKRLMDAFRGAMTEMERDEREFLRVRALEVEAAASGARTATSAGTFGCLLVVLLAGVFITRALTTQVSTVVRHVQSSSAELQAAANQQVAGAKEQATAMSQISTTMSELLATSRQIAESTQRVSHVAAQTVTAARGGDDTVQRAQEASASIKRQVDTIVTHMLELGRKSQQIGVVLDLINELAEQTNILAINATIEAAGASESGRRFGVVADEIRKLADRVGNSTKEIRALVDDVRSSVNTTVMATETGAKAVDAGTRQFHEVAASFKQIASLVGTSTEAAKEIELSTKQQATAVEQVNSAIVNVSQAARETEASSTQTLQTSVELTKLSRELARIVEPQAA